MENTVKDFWKMIFEKNVHTIVTLNALYEEDQVNIRFHWKVRKSRIFPETNSFLQEFNFSVGEIQEILFVRMNTLHVLQAFKTNFFHLRKFYGNVISTNSRLNLGEINL